jgi:6-phosphofructokinase 1
MVQDSTDPWRLGGISRQLAQQLEEKTGLECRVTVLGHLQRGGSPVPADRILATHFGCAAADLATQGCFGQMVALRHGEVISVPIAQAVARQKLVSPNDPLIVANRDIGVCFGDR